MSFLDTFVRCSERPGIAIDAALKRDFMGDKILIAEKKARELVDELPCSKKAISLFLDRVFDFELQDCVSFSLGIHGRKREICLMVTFSGNTPIYRVSAISNPDFRPNNGGIS